MRRALVVSIGASAAGLALLGVFLWRLALWPAPAPDYTEQQIRAGQREYRTIAMRPLGDRGAIREALDRMVWQNDPPPGCGSKQALLDEVADFLYFRFAQPSVEAYKAWRRSTGCRFKDLAESLRPWYVDEAYEAYFGEPFPDDPDVERLFDRFWSAGLEWGGGVNRPVALAEEPKGLACVFGTITPGDPRRAMLAGEMSADLWHGGIASTMRGWWRPAQSTRDLLKRHGRAHYAVVGVILEYADGSRRPLILTWPWDPHAQRWVLEDVNVKNFPAAALSAMEF